MVAQILTIDKGLGMRYSSEVRVLSAKGGVSSSNLLVATKNKYAAVA